MGIPTKNILIREDVNDFHSLGEWVESLIDDEYVKNIVARYTKESDPSVDLSNAINILDDNTKKEIKSQIDNYLQKYISVVSRIIIIIIPTKY